MVKLSADAQNEYLIIKELVAKRITTKQAAIKLSKAESSVKRIKAKYLKEGKSAFVHKNTGNSHALAVDKSVVAVIVDLYKSQFINWNFTHFYEYAKYHNLLSGIELPTLRTVSNILRRAGYTSPQTKRKSRRANNHPSRPRRASFGELIQMDASVHDWLGLGFKFNLHLAIDDATSFIVSGWFEKQETLHGYYMVAKHIFEVFGIPKAFYTDKRTVFEYKAGKRKKDENIQFKRVCNTLGIEIITTSVAQAKGRVERSFRTHQDRLLNELQFKEINTIDEANEYLRSYITHHNSRFAFNSTDFSSSFRKFPADIDMNKLLCISEPRKVLNGCVVSYGDKAYQPVDENGEVVQLALLSEVQFITALNGEMYIKHGEEYYDVVKMRDYAGRGHTPSENHPWKQSYKRSSS